MALSKEEKKNLIIAAMIIIAALIILWLWGKNQIYGGTSAGDAYTFPGLDTGGAPSAYNNYNLPPYVGPNLPGINNPIGGQGTTGCGCNQQYCGPPGNVQAISIPFFQMFLGMLA